MIDVIEPLALSQSLMAVSLSEVMRLLSGEAEVMRSLAQPLVGTEPMVKKGLVAVKGLVPENSGLDFHPLRVSRPIASCRTRRGAPIASYAPEELYPSVDTEVEVGETVGEVSRAVAAA